MVINMPVQIDEQALAQQLARILKDQLAAQLSDNNQNGHPPRTPEKCPELDLPPHTPEHIACQIYERMREALLEYLNRHNVSRSQAARIAGIDRAALKRFLNGTSFGSIRLWGPLIYHLRINPMYIFFGTGDPLLD